MAGSIKLLTPSGGSVTINATDTASTLSLTLPANTDSIITANTPQTLTNKTLTNPVINGFTGNTSIVNIGSGQIYKDVAGNVGIGTNSPNSILHVEGAGANFYLKSNNTTDAVVRMFVNGSERGAVRVNSSSFMSFDTSGTTRLTIDAAGNVGIGSSSPVSKLEIAGSTPTVSVTPTTQNQTTGINLRVLNAGTYGAARIEAVNLTTYDSNLLFYTNTTTSNTLVERMRLDSSGNLGLGVTPSGWRTDASFKALQMPGGSFTAYIAGGLDQTPGIAANGYVDSGGTWRYINSRPASWYIQNGGMHVWYTAPSGTAGNPITFNQAMTLDASGNLLVGTSSGAVGAGLVVNYASGSGTYLDLGHPSSAASGYGYIRFVWNGNIIGQVHQNGTTGVTYATSSDERLKTNVTPANSAIQSILDFSVDQFDWISSGEHQDFGAVAQKAVNVIPEMVSVPSDPEEMWGIDWSKAVPRLIKTIQEMHTKNTELESRLALLESK